MPDAHYNVFISYRREHVDFARLLKLAFESKGYSVFFDYDSLQDGEFNKRIYTAIENCDVCIAVYSKGSLDSCERDDDWVRIELEYAIRHGTKIVPVARTEDYNGWTFPVNLPDSLASLRNIQISEIHTGQFFEHSIDECVTNRFPQGVGGTRRKPAKTQRQGVFTSRNLSRTVAQHPWNVVFFPDRVLFEAAPDDSGEFSADDRAAALAELAVRYFLSRDQKYRPVLEKALGPDRLRNFLDRCSLCTQGRSSVETLRRTLEGGLDRGLAVSLCARFHRLLSADGVIPVCDCREQEGYLLTFSFVGAVPPNGCPRVLDADDEPIEAWSGAMRHLPEPVGANIRVDAHLGAEGGWAPPVGNSLLLPVLCAWWRREGRLPAYNPFRLLFTGAFRGGAIERVDTEAKAEKVSACVKDGILVYPVSVADPPEETQIPEGADSDTVFQIVRVLAENVADATADYAIGRMTDYESEVRQDRFDDWEALLQRLEHLRANLDPDLDRDAWLMSLLLTSAAHCHAGHTSQAAEWNARAIDFAQVDDPVLLRALVEQLVILQDTEDFEGILSLSPDLGERIDRLAGGSASASAMPNGIPDSVLDLSMRFHGTMGQFHAYAAISGIRPDVCTPASASAHFNTAFQCARKLHGKARSESQRLARAKDVAQDANYLVLRAALFDHAELSSALDRSLRLSRRCGNAEAKNVLFALRYHAFGLYRSVLAGEPIAEDNLDRHREFLAQPEGQWWAPGTRAKYLGAVLAASARPGSAEADSALGLFRFAADALPLASTDILRKIAMTVRAEAYRSLHGLFPNEADRFLAEAKDLLAGVPDRGNSWADWLDNPETAPFPGLSYWY